MTGVITSEQIRQVVREVLAEEKKYLAENPDPTMLKTVSAILTSFGIRDDERREFVEDFRYLRRWRVGAERLQGWSLHAVVLLVLGGLASALWLGIKAMIGK